MQMLKLKYLGEVETLVRLVPNGEKVAVKTGQTIEVEADLAKSMMKTYKGRFDVVGANTVAQEPPKVVVPKKGKKRETAEVKKEEVEKGAEE